MKNTEYRIALLVYGQDLIKNCIYDIKNDLNKIIDLSENKNNSIEILESLNNLKLVKTSKFRNEHNGLDISFNILTKNYHRLNDEDLNIESFMDKIQNSSYLMQFLRIELKPLIGDDFPSVLRQMKKLKANILIIGSYQGKGASFEELKLFFKNENIQVVLESDIEIKDLNQNNLTLNFNYILDSKE